MCALDYKKTENPLTCSCDAKNLADLAKACGIEDITLLTDEEEPLQKHAVKHAIGKIAERCAEDDYLILYYSGHGTQLKHASGAPENPTEEHEDDAYCFQTHDGQISYTSCMADNEVADSLTALVPEKVRTLVLSDCCHSDTIADFSKPVWEGREAMSISGCLDSQTSGDTGSGGIMTHSMLLAIEKLSHEGKRDYSVGELYNVLLEEKAIKFKDAPQQISFEHVPSVAPGGMAWPLVPQKPYKAPLSEGNKERISHVSHLFSGLPTTKVEANGADHKTTDEADGAAHKTKDEAKTAANKT